MPSLSVFVIRRMDLCFLCGSYGGASCDLARKGLAVRHDHPKLYIENMKDGMAEKISDAAKSGLADFGLPDPAKLAAESGAGLAEHAALLAKTLPRTHSHNKAKPNRKSCRWRKSAKTLGEVWQAHLAEPEKLMEAQTAALGAISEVWNNALGQSHGRKVEAVVAPARNDKRFKDKDWVENSVFDFLKQVYLVTTRWAHRDGAILLTALIPIRRQKAQLLCREYCQCFFAFKQFPAHQS